MGVSSAALAAGGGEAGLPQLKIGTWPSQLFWLVVIFAVGYVFMARVVTPRIGSVLEERRTRLDEDLTRARDASAEAAQTRADYEASLEEARSEAAEFAREAAPKAQAKADAVEAKAAKKMATKSALPRPSSPRHAKKPKPTSPRWRPRPQSRRQPRSPGSRPPRHRPTAP